VKSFRCFTIFFTVVENRRRPRHDRDSRTPF
jgi:hypothetical protein